MPTLRFLLPWMAPFAPAALLWHAFAQAIVVRRRSCPLREADLSDWLLHDIGLKDGRDTTARRMGRDAERRLVR